MNIINMTIEKRQVLTEAGKTSSYAGAKRTADGTAYDHLRTTDEDAVLLERFWREAGDMATGALRRFVAGTEKTAIDPEATPCGDYTVRLAVSPRYNTAMTESMRSSLFSFFVNYIMSKWVEPIDAQAAQTYAATAQTLLADVSVKLYSKVRPTREETV